MKQDWSGCRDLAAPFQFFASTKIIITIVLSLLEQIFKTKRITHPNGGGIGPCYPNERIICPQPPAPQIETR